MSAAIEAENLVKEFRVAKHGKPNFLDFLFGSYSTMRAVNGISLKVKKGEVLGLLGPNGAGKTTLIKLLCGLAQPTSGNALIFGEKPENNLSRIGVMLGSSMIYYRISGYANLEYFARIYGVENVKQRIMEVTRLAGLEEKWLHDYVEHYSIGMKTKLALARALLHDPEILFLDEPTQGLDPWVSLQIREKIREMDKTIILSSHSLQDLTMVCDNIAFIKAGGLGGVFPASKTDFKRIGLDEKIF